MSKVAVVFWTSGDHTRAMAEIVADAAREAGADVELIEAASFSSADLDNFDAIAFGCPAMGDEVLEESEFQPMWDDVKESLGSKKVGLFGSYGWGGGDWMRLWAEEAEGLGVNLVKGGIAAEEFEDGAPETQDLIELGQALA